MLVTLAFVCMHWSVAQFVEDCRGVGLNSCKWAGQVAVDYVNALPENQRATATFQPHFDAVFVTFCSEPKAAK
jgi:hypothetical protein